MIAFPSRVFAAAIAVLLALLGAGCVSELRVGIEQSGSDAAVDGGVPAEDAAVDAGELGPCDPDACPSDPVLARTCGTCLRNDQGACEWVEGECPPPEPCLPSECEAVLLVPAIGKEAVACADGTPPLCERSSETGICGYVCPEASSCGSLSGAGCGADQYCLFAAGVCGAKDAQGGLCTPRPSSCDDALEPVCGCDGETYSNACQAASKGVNVSYPGSCAAAPVRCGTCSGEAPSPRVACGDGENESGAICVAGAGGACAWQWLECPGEGSCDKLADLAPGRCFDDSACAVNERCEGAVVCPCASFCFAADAPGYCKEIPPKT